MVKKATQNKIGKFTKPDIRKLCSSLSISSIEGHIKIISFCSPMIHIFTSGHNLPRSIFFAHASSLWNYFSLYYSSHFELQTLIVYLHSHFRYLFQYPYQSKIQDFLTKIVYIKEIPKILYISLLKIKLQIK